LLFENENHFSLLLQKNTNSIKRLICTPTELKNKINKSKINISKNLLDKSNKFEINKYVILKKGKYYYDNIYHFLMSEKISKKMHKNSKNLYVETYDWKKLVYPADLYREDDDNKKKQHKREYFRKICAKYELDKDNNLIYKGNNPQYNKLNLRIPFEYEKLDILSTVHKKTGHTGYHRLYESIRDSNIFWDSLTNDCKNFVKNCPTCIKFRTKKALKPKIIAIKTKEPKL